MKLTLHFNAEEFGKELDDQRVQNAFLLASLLLEPLRAKFGVVKITSGFRNEADQKRLLAAGYKPSNTSQHLRGEAVDFVCPYAPNGMGEVFSYIRDVLRWPGETIWYRKKGHVHTSLPRYNVKADFYIDESGVAIPPAR